MQNDNKKVFLETSIHQKRVFGLRAEKEGIEAYLKDKTILTSAFVLKEFRNLTIKAMIEVYFLIYNHPEDPPADAIIKFERINSFKPRRVKAGYAIMVELLRKVGLPTEWEQALVTVENLIRSTENRFMESVNAGELIDNVQCEGGRVRLQLTANPLKDLTDFFEAIQCTEYCRPVFFNKKRSSLEQILSSDLTPFRATSYDSKKRTEFFKVLIPIYEKIVKDIYALSHEDYTNQTSDTIIALESPIKAILISYDNIFPILCGVLEKEFYIFKQIPLSSFKSNPPTS